jgi:MoaA/NifB/PqqE/SkfB family radical SAM enzyme
MDNLKNYFCNMPFRNIEVINNGDVYGCCFMSPANERYPVKYILGNILEDDVETIWNGERARETRRSILDESFRYCDKNACPVMQKNHAGLIDKTQKKNYFVDVFNGINESEKKYLQNNQDTCDNLPTKLHLVTSRICNYRCASCNPPKLGNKNLDYKSMEERSVELLEKLTPFIKKAQYLFFGSQGEPLASPSIRSWFKNASEDLVKNLWFMEMQTNGSLFNREFWDSIPPYLQKKLTVVQVSVDASSKDTYENKNRIGGNWENLLGNIEFISKLPEVQSLALSFVVQDNNFNEMKDFVRLGEKFDCRVRFTRIKKWPSIDTDDYKTMNVFDVNHKNHQKLLEVLRDEIFKSPKVDMLDVSGYMR